MELKQNESLLPIVDERGKLKVKWYEQSRISRGRAHINTCECEIRSQSQL